jgi:hypothetical protein
MVTNTSQSVAQGGPFPFHSVAYPILSASLATGVSISTAAGLKALPILGLMWRTSLQQLPLIKYARCPQHSAIACVSNSLTPLSRYFLAQAFVFKGHPVSSVPTHYPVSACSSSRRGQLIHVLRRTATSLLVTHATLSYHASNSFVFQMFDFAAMCETFPRLPPDMISYACIKALSLCA